MTGHLILVWAYGRMFGFCVGANVLRLSPLKRGKFTNNTCYRHSPIDKATFSHGECRTILGILWQTTSHVAATAANVWAVDRVKSDTGVVLRKILVKVKLLTFSTKQQLSVCERLWPMSSAQRGYPTQLRESEGNKAFQSFLA